MSIPSGPQPASDHCDIMKMLDLLIARCEQHNGLAPGTLAKANARYIEARKVVKP